MDVISFGPIFLEVVFGDMKHRPVPGEEIFVDQFAFSLGGGAVTAAVEARRAGASAAAATVLGDDVGSKLAVELCLREGVDLSPSKRLTGAVAGITVVLNFDQDRAFVSHVPPRSTAERPEPERWPEVLEHVRPEWCYLHAGPLVPPVLERAHAVGTRVVLDFDSGAIDEFPDEVVKCATLADVLVPTEAELRRLTRARDLGEAIVSAASWCPWVVVKRGGAGAVAVDNGRATEVTEGLEDVVVRDRTGAGDAFAGAMVGNLARGAGLLEAVAAGNTAGSMAVARMGATGEMPVWN
jgi:sugar/nucleoside kinase (ribokinase family)